MGVCGLQELLSSVPPGCELHYVGKRGGQPSIKQQEINKVLVTLCQQVSGYMQLGAVTSRGWETQKGTDRQRWGMSCCLTDGRYAPHVECDQKSITLGEDVAVLQIATQCS